MTYSRRTWTNEDYEASDANAWEGRIEAEFGVQAGQITGLGTADGVLDGRLDALEALASAVIPNTGVADAYTLVLADAGKVVETQTNTNAKTITVPPNSTAFPYGATGHTVIELFNRGTGGAGITITPGSGVTIVSPGAVLTITQPYATAVLRKRDINTWALSGNLG